MKQHPFGIDSQDNGELGGGGGGFGGFFSSIVKAAASVLAPEPPPPPPVPVLPVAPPPSTNVAGPTVDQVSAQQANQGAESRRITKRKVAAKQILGGTSTDTKTLLGQ